MKLFTFVAAFFMLQSANAAELSDFVGSFEGDGDQVEIFAVATSEVIADCRGLGLQVSGETMYFCHLGEDEVYTFEVDDARFEAKSRFENDVLIMDVKIYDLDSGVFKDQGKLTLELTSTNDILVILTVGSGRRTLVLLRQ